MLGTCPPRLYFHGGVRFRFLSMTYFALAGTHALLHCKCKVNRLWRLPCGHEKEQT